MSEDKHPKDSSVFVVTRKTESNLIRSEAAEAEDKFAEYYLSAEGGKNGANIIEPPYFFKSLREAARENTSLAPCVATMEVNVDGTGYYFVDDKGDMVADGDEKLAQYMEFTDTPYPQTTFLTMRRLLRRDLEETGNWFIEVLRNLTGEIVFIRRVAPEDMRLCRLSDPIEKKVKVSRNGVDTEITFQTRERRFAQIVGSKPRYFAEFGASRKLNKITGEWEGETTDGGNEGSAEVKPEDCATEIIHGTLDKDSQTPYGLPRWISSQRAIRGQVEAEDLNLAFFDAGGVPPVLVTVEGGELTESARNALTMIFSGKAKEKLEGAVVEAQSVSGTIDKEGRVGITVHQFGDKNDSMFENYDTASEMKIRKTFRLPKLFMGDIDGVNFATAYTMYMVTETQVFEPERMEFDSILNNTIFSDPTFSAGYKLKSKPLNLKNIESRMKAIELSVNNSAITKEQMVDLLNRETDMNIMYDQNALDKEATAAFEKQKAMLDTAMGDKQGDDEDVLASRDSTDQSAPVAAPAQKSEQVHTISPIEMLDLAERVARAAFDSDVKTLKAVGEEVKALTDSEFYAIKKLAYHNLMMNQADDETLALVFPDLANVEAM